MMHDKESGGVSAQDRFQAGQDPQDDSMPRSRPTSLAGIVGRSEMEYLQSANDTIYLCNFKVSVDGDWLCLKELDNEIPSSGSIMRNRFEHLDITPELERMARYPNYPIAPKERDPIVIEKSNLVNILKLVIKEVIESSMVFARQLDSDHIPLQHFFIVIEHVLKHGLRPKKGLLGPKKELWDLLQLVEKKDPEACDITASVRELPTVKTPMGRTRAWLRLALMQKKIADYFRVLVDQNDDLLAEYYESRSIIRSEEAIIISGLLVSMNVVDCNLCIKEEDLDSQQGVIDFSLYLKSNKDSGHEGATDSSEGNITAVLDQKHYIEELNRHLNATVGNLQSKVEGLTTTNALMKEDLAIARGALYRSQEENKRLLYQLERTALTSRISTIEQISPGIETLSKSSRDSSEGRDENLKLKLNQEIKKREELEKDLKFQRSMKAEMEMAMKIMEKTVFDKQETIFSLKDQLEDIKSINLDMYTKLQECETEISEKATLIMRLESKTVEISRMLEKLNRV